MCKINVKQRKGRLPIITTKNLVLRDIQVDDITQEYVNWLNDREVTKFLEIRFERQTQEKIEKYVNDMLRDVEHSKHFGVYDTRGTRLVGTVTLPEINWNHSYADISFVIGHPDARGNKYAEEAVRAVIQYMFQHCDLKKLWAGYYDGHGASKHILGKVGFREEGRIKEKLVDYRKCRVDHIIVGLLSKDFQA